MRGETVRPAARVFNVRPPRVVVAPRDNSFLVSTVRPRLVASDDLPRRGFARDSPPRARAPPSSERGAIARRGVTAFRADALSRGCRARAPPHPPERLRRRSAPRRVREVARRVVVVRVARLLERAPDAGARAREPRVARGRGGSRQGTPARGGPARAEAAAALRAPGAIDAVAELVRSPAAAARRAACKALDLLLGAVSSAAAVPPCPPLLVALAERAAAVPSSGADADAALAAAEARTRSPGRARARRSRPPRSRRTPSPNPTSRATSSRAWRPARNAPSRLVPGRRARGGGSTRWHRRGPDLRLGRRARRRRRRRAGDVPRAGPGRVDRSSPRAPKRQPPLSRRVAGAGAGAARAVAPRRRFARRGGARIVRRRRRRRGGDVRRNRVPRLREAHNAAPPPPRRRPPPGDRAARGPSRRWTRATRRFARRRIASSPSSREDPDPDPDPNPNPNPNPNTNPNPNLRRAATRSAPQRSRRRWRRTSLGGPRPPRRATRPRPGGSPPPDSGPRRRDSSAAIGARRRGSRGRARGGVGPLRARRARGPRPRRLRRGGGDRGRVPRRRATREPGRPPRARARARRPRGPSARGAAAVGPPSTRRENKGFVGFQNSEDSSSVFVRSSDASSTDASSRADRWIASAGSRAATPPRGRGARAGEALLALLERERSPGGSRAGGSSSSSPSGASAAASASADAAAGGARRRRVGSGRRATARGGARAHPGEGALAAALATRPTWRDAPRARARGNAPPRDRREPVERALRARAGRTPRPGTTRPGAEGSSAPRTEAEARRASPPTTTTPGARPVAMNPNGAPTDRDGKKDRALLVALLRALVELDPARVEGGAVRAALERALRVLASEDAEDAFGAEARCWAAPPRGSRVSRRSRGTAPTRHSSSSGRGRASRRISRRRSPRRSSVPATRFTAGSTKPPPTSPLGSRTRSPRSRRPRPRLRARARGRRLRVRRRRARPGARRRARGAVPRSLAAEHERRSRRPFAVSARGSNARRGGRGVASVRPSVRVRRRAGRGGVRAAGSRATPTPPTSRRSPRWRSSAARVNSPRWRERRGRGSALGSDRCATTSARCSRRRTRRRRRRRRRGPGSTKGRPRAEQDRAK